MRRSLLVLLLAAGLSAGLAGGAGARERRGPEGGRTTEGARAAGASRPAYANPSAVIAAEYAFARDVAQRGRWTAFAAAAAPDAVMFVPQMVWAQAWLKGRPNPPGALQWQPYEVWSSCDGSLVASHGGWTSGEGAGARRGWFTTLWQRQPDGSYKWVLDHGNESAAADPAPDMIAAHVADCPPRSRRAPNDPAGSRRAAKPPKQPKPPALKDLPPLDPAGRSGAARDGSLRWSVAVAADRSRTLTVTWVKDGQETAVLTDRVAPAPGRQD